MLTSWLMLGTAAFAALQPSVLAQDYRDNCDVRCETSYRDALRFEHSKRVNVDVKADSFYTNPSNLSAYKAGDLVKWQDLTADQSSRLWNIPGGMSLSRFFYMSEDIDGNPIPATGFALLPFSNPLGNDKPLRTLAWAHGTAGYTRECAPSNHKGLYYEWAGPFLLAQAGYAVIATDYAGQGSDIPQGFMYESGTLHAADVTHSLRAAREILGNRITEEWVVIGHSEGGLSAWRTNEREARTKNPLRGFLGAVSVAPALRPLKLIPESFRLAKGGPVRDVVSIYVLQSISKLYKSIKIENYISDIVASRMAVADQGCLNTGTAMYGNLTETQLYKNTSWLTHPDVIDWQKRYNGAGPHQLAAPMLVVQGLSDALTYTEVMVEDFNETCKEFPKSSAELVLYPSLGHDSAFQAAQADCLTWIEDRFNKVKTTEGCKRRTVAPVAKHFSPTQQTWMADAPLL